MQTCTETSNESGDEVTFEEGKALAETILSGIPVDDAPPGKEAIWEDLSGTALYIWRSFEKVTSWDEVEVSPGVLEELPQIGDEFPHLRDLCEEMTAYLSSLSPQEPINLGTFELGREAAGREVCDQLQASVAAEAPLDALARAEADELWRKVAGCGFLRFLSEHGIEQEVIALYDSYRNICRCRASPKCRQELQRLEILALAALRAPPVSDLGRG